MFGTDGDSPADTIVQSLHDHGTIEHEVAAAIDGLLDLNLIHLAAGGWRHSTRLCEGARVPRYAPGWTEIMPMVAHHPASPPALTSSSR
ncbi:hypothetical protein GCM10010193_18570 [Kitasatospora atroaurantiaca]|uniref:Uncharacterized protein n=1 Tax=Kitasatospora atroaurantiaca TaxID=285545 RepID=A0A561EPB9_9ACTN|nr:hypothetical protein [Kitasatospora atroaurantiaca]TWE17451.1 hypothetical protein FB465_2477 [Kitasatospora atroaurantiaca]